MSSHAGNRGTDQYYFSALRCQRLFLLSHFKVRDRERRTLVWVIFGWRTSASHVSCTMHDGGFKECIKTTLCYDIPNLGRVHFWLNHEASTCSDSRKWFCAKRAFKSEWTADVRRYMSSLWEASSGDLPLSHLLWYHWWSHWWGHHRG